jgi:hypothetical protein
MRIVMTMLAFLMAGCAPISQFYAALFVSSEGCLTEKIQFTQDGGCLNDDSFEFCVANDAALLDTLNETVPNMTCIPSAGRARCDTETQVLCMVSTDGLCKADQPNVLTDEGWELACIIASQPYIEQLVPTWYE